MCIANPMYHPCSHTSVTWLHCPAKESRQDQPCQNVNFLRGEESMNACPLKSCKFSKRDKGWICCHCQGGPNYTGWCTMPSLHPTLPWSDMGAATCDHGCCKHCVRVKGRVSLPSPFHTFSDHFYQGKHQLPLSTGNNLHLPVNARGGGCESSSTGSRASFWGISSSSENYKSSPNSSPHSPAEGNYTGYLGPPDAALRSFYDRYVPYGSPPNTNDDPDIDVHPESGVNMCWAERPVEQIPVQSLSVEKKRKDKGKETDSRTKKSKTSSHKTRR